MYKPHTLPDDKIKTIEKKQYAVNVFLFLAGAGAYVWAMAAVASQFDLDHDINKGAQAALSFIFGTIGAGLVGATAKPILLGREYEGDDSSRAIATGAVIGLFSLACAFCVSDLIGGGFNFYHDPVITVIETISAAITGLATLYALSGTCVKAVEEYGEGKKLGPQ